MRRLKGIIYSAFGRLRSTAPHSMLIHTANLQKLSMTQAWAERGNCCEGRRWQTMYQQAEAKGKIAIGGTAATVCYRRVFKDGGVPLQLTFSVSRGVFFFYFC